MESAPTLRSPQEAFDRLNLLAGRRKELQKRRAAVARRAEEVNAFLQTAPKVTGALQELGEQLFHNLLTLLQDKMTLALREILEQPISFRAEGGFSRGHAQVTFYAERNGNPEDILDGQGGSVANILSVGLRMFALASLDEDRHRRLLVLDEQDCWLRPDLVPKLVKIVHEAGRALGFQVLMISHHDSAVFEPYADKIYALEPRSDGVVSVTERYLPPAVADPDPAN